MVKRGADNIRQILMDKLPAIKDVQTKYLTAERAVKLACLSLTKTPGLADCSPLTVFEAVVTAVQLGLEIGGPLQHCHLVPYGKVCTLLLGYRGLINLARRSGDITTIEARLVYANEHFDVSYGTDAVIRHIPDFTVERPDTEIVAAYSVATLKDGGKQFEIMTRQEIMKIRNRGKVWNSDFGEMCRKTPTRRLCKYLPMTAELAHALSIEDEIERNTAEHVPVRSERSTVALNQLPDEPDDAPAPDLESVVEAARAPARPGVEAGAASIVEGQLQDSVAKESKERGRKRSTTSVGDADAKPPQDMFAQ